MSSEVVANLDSFCPHCRAELELPARWLGRLGALSRLRPVFLPPEPERAAARPTAAGFSAARRHSLSDSNGRPDRASTAPLRQDGSHQRRHAWCFHTGFVLCLFLTLIFFLDFSPARWRYSGS